MFVFRTVTLKYQKSMNQSSLLSSLQSLVLVSYTGSLNSPPAAAALAALSRLTLLELQGATGLGSAGLAGEQTVLCLCVFVCRV